MKISTYLNRTFVLFGAFMIFSTAMVSAAGFSAKFMRIEAIQLDDIVEVKWLTDSEYNNDFFTVQRSVDGGNIWEDLGTVDSYGNSPGSGTYDYNDLNPVSGIIHYRLRQTDYDGTYTYSFDVQVEVEFFTTEDEDQAQISPNPSDDYFTIELINVVEDVEVTLMDLSGKLIAIHTDVNDNQIQVKPINKVFGMYFVMIANKQRTIVKKIKFN